MLLFFHIQDKLAERKLPYERRFGIPFDGPVTPFGAVFFFQKTKRMPISTSDKSRLHQFGTSVSRNIHR